MAESQTAPGRSPPAVRSSFVTVLGWILVVLNGLALLGALAQGVLVLVLPEVLLPRAGLDEAGLGGLVTALQLFAALFVGLAALMIYASVAFLRRREWARRLFVASFAAGIIVNVLSLLLFALGYGLGFGGLTLPEPSATGIDVANMLDTAVAMSLVLAVGSSLLFAWLIKRLGSPGVKAEFASQRGYGPAGR